MSIFFYSNVENENVKRFFFLNTYLFVPETNK